MKVATETYVDQKKQWPPTGRHILAHFDDETIVVYQAYCHAIGRFAAENQYFGGLFKFDRMSWIKPNFLWMMYRSGWGTKLNQEVVLAVWLRREAFEQILSQAVQSSFNPEVYATEEDWKRALQQSDVRLQWDPDHDPTGCPLPRRALQLGMRGAALANYARQWIVEIEDVTPFVAEQRRHVTDGDPKRLTVPREREYPVDAGIAKRLGIDHGG